MASNRVAVITGSRRSVRVSWLALLLLPLLVGLTSNPLHHVWAWDPSQQVGDFLVYDYFISNISVTQKDGPSENGTIVNMGFAPSTIGTNKVLLTDQGVTIRTIFSNRSVVTMTGAVGEPGFINGNLVEARFNGAQALVEIDHITYIADSHNKAIRRITADGLVDTLIGDGLEAPADVLWWPAHSALLISDLQSGGSGVIFYTSVVNAFLLPLFSSSTLQPRALAALGETIYYVDNYQLGAVQLQGGKGTQWNIGNTSCTFYVSGLMISPDEKELWYHARLKDRSWWVMGLKLDAAHDVAPTLCPRKVFPWPPDQKALPTPLSLIPRSATSLFLIEQSNIYLLSTIPVTITSSHSGSSEAIRSPAFAAFPTAAFPTEYPKRMSWAYYYMMEDVSIAFGTTDYLARFNTTLGPQIDIPGDVNVSLWDGNITAATNKDNSLFMTYYEGPTSLSPSETAEAIANSSWTNLRNYLRGIPPSVANLSTFCVVDCTADTCYDMPNGTWHCRQPPKAACDDVCIGAICSSVVFGAVGVVLIVMMLANPANMWAALLSMPV